MKVNEFKPKYKTIEAVEDFGYIIHIVGLLNWDAFKMKYGQREILSVYDFEDTKSTSIIFKGYVS